MGSDDEEDCKAPKENFQEIMQQCLSQLGKRQNAGEDCLDPGYGLDPGDIDAPDPFSDDPRNFGFGSGDAGEGSRPLDLAALHDQAFHLLLTRLVCQPGASNIARALLLDAEL